MWTIESNIIYYIPINYLHTNKIAFFDLDKTLITNLNGLNPSYKEKSSDNWIFLGNIPEILNNYYKDNYQIVIITNQLKFDNIIFEKIKKIQQYLEIENNWSPIILISKAKDMYRKPNIKFADLLKDKLNIDIGTESFMCGDAIGKNDEYPAYRWGEDDYLFSGNLNIKFYRPIDIFKSNINIELNNCKEDMIIMMGNMGSGKSTFSKNLKKYKNYVICESDVLKSHVKMVKCCEKNLANNNKIVIDATNPYFEKRKIWIDLAKKYNKSFKVVFIIIDGRPFNAIRERKVPEIAYSLYTKKFEIPHVDENYVVCY